VDENPEPPPTPPTSTASLAGAPAPSSQPIDLSEIQPAGGDDPTLTFIEPSESEVEAEAPTLAAAARQERLRRDLEAPPVLVINNKNIAAYAAGGVLTIASPAMVDEGEESEDDLEGTPVGASTEEVYWQDRGLAIRKRWREAVDRIPDLVVQVEELRQRFYSTDDPVYRDSEIKPLWDKAVADLEAARFQAARGEQEVLAFLEEGRRAGALPGWLREGAELEPEPVVIEVEPDPGEPGEPEIYDEGDEEPPGG
jgi:hypothetical protein